MAFYSVVIIYKKDDVVDIIPFTTKQQAEKAYPYVKEYVRISSNIGNSMKTDDKFESLGRKIYGSIGYRDEASYTGLDFDDIDFTDEDEYGEFIEVKGVRYYVVEDYIKGK